MNDVTNTFEFTVDSKIAYLEPETTEATVGERISFDVRDGTWIDSLDWEFGDGATATDWWTEHRYEDTGRYTVVLNVTDSTDNTAADEVTIKIS